MGQTEAKDSWPGFKPGLWQRDVNVRWFLQQNYTPYEGDDSFLAPATARTRRVWKKLEDLFVEERKKGVLDVSQVPSSITAHAPVCPHSTISRFVSQRPSLRPSCPTLPTRCPRLLWIFPRQSRRA